MDTKSFASMIFVFIGIVIIGFTLFVNNRGATEKRAYEAVEIFIQENDLQVQRVACAGDSDNDGNATCVIQLKDGKKMRLECPVNWSDRHIWGATQCKELFFDLQSIGIQ